MGLKKYEIITVGSDRRVRALRSWQVGDRYVNIGDVGGIVYDEKTLSQDGACWLFKGNFGFPGARIGGDSIVDVGEATLSAAGTPAVDILGSSVVVGSKLQFEAEQTGADAVVLTADDFEQGDYLFVAGAKAENQKVNYPSVVRTKSPIFMGGASLTLKLDVPGYTVQTFRLDADLVMVGATANTVTGAGVTLTVPAAQYCLIRLRKDPVANITPADAATAAVTFTGTYETKLSIIDSRVEINPATSTAVATVKPGGTYTFISGARYPEAIIRNSKVSMTVPGVTSRSFRLLGQIIGSTATLDATAGDLSMFGQYSNVKNLMISGILTSDLGVKVYNSIQAANCDNFKIDSEVIPPGAFNAAIAANMPFIFQGCNVPGGKFYHHAQIANTYKNIDFALAQADLGKIIRSGYSLASSEVEGMYRLSNGTVLTALVEAYESVKDIESSIQSAYGTTIYKDAYLSGRFDIAGTNVFGNKVPGHPIAVELKATPRVVQGTLNTLAIGSTVTGVVPSGIRVVTPMKYRINSKNGISVKNIPEGVRAQIVVVNEHNVIEGASGIVSTDTDFTTYAKYAHAFVIFSKPGDAAITPDELGDATVTVYNGCKIVNTGATAVNMRGNIRVEDNAALVNASVVGSGYFGGNCVASGLRIGGTVFMSDNASFVKTGGSADIRNLKMTDNAKAVIGDVVITGSLHIKDNAVFTPTALYVAEADFYLQDNAKVTAGVSVNGSLFLKDDAAVNQALTVIGDVTLCGSYSQTATRTWTGKRVIDNENEPEYDNNVRTQYDF